MSKKFLCVFVCFWLTGAAIVKAQTPKPEAINRLAELLENHAGESREAGHMVSQYLEVYPKRTLRSHLSLSAKGQYNLGIIFRQGLGTYRDDKEAGYWFWESANQGYAPAQYELGRLFASGDGIPQDPEQAQIWLQKAREQGYPPSEQVEEGTEAEGTAAEGMVEGTEAEGTAAEGTEAEGTAAEGTAAGGTAAEGTEAGGTRHKADEMAGVIALQIELFFYELSGYPQTISANLIGLSGGVQWASRFPGRTDEIRLRYLTGAIAEDLYYASSAGVQHINSIQVTLTGVSYLLGNQNSSGEVLGGGYDLITLGFETTEGVKNVLINSLFIAPGYRVLIPAVPGMAVTFTTRIGSFFSLLNVELGYQF